MTDLVPRGRLVADDAKSFWAFLVNAERRTSGMDSRLKFPHALIS